VTPPFYKEIRPENLPMPDGQVMQLIQYVLKEDADVQKLTRLIAFNPALTTQILSIVNSAFYGFRHPVSTLSDALVTLGMVQLKSLVLCFAVKEALAKQVIPSLDIDQFWGDSLLRGVAARQLGQMVNSPVEEAFSTGMLQDIGLLVLFALEPDKADRWPLLRANLPDRRLAMEAELFQITHVNMGRLLTEKWQLPAPYARAIGAHHKFTGEKGRPKTREDVLTALALLADLCNAIFTSQDKPRALALLEKRAKAFFGLSPEPLHTMLDRLPDQVEATARAMKLPAPSREQFSTILNQAGQKLAKDSLDFQELTWQLQQTLKERDEYAARMDAELAIAREIQAGLLPNLTGMPAAAAFNLPARHLSGDFYDYITLDDDSRVFCLGDVSGKGTAAALLMAKTLALFRWLSRAGHPLKEVMAQVNQSLWETAVRGMFVTLAAGHIKGGELTLVNMGHPPPLLAGSRGMSQIPASGPPLGILDRVDISTDTRSMENQRLYLYSDGFLEGRLKEDPGKTLGTKGFLRWLVQSGKMGVQAQAGWIMNQCQTRLDRHRDDLTLMILSGPS